MALSPSDQTRMINQALTELGSTTRLTSIDDTSSNSGHRIRVLWDDIARGMLVQHTWNFAVRRRSLNAATDAPEFEWARKFQLPEDCLRWLPPRRGDADFYEAETEGGFILTNAAAPLRCRYIAAIDDYSKWPPLFVRAVVMAIAASLAEPETQSQGDKDRILDRAERALRDAKRVDGLETGESPRANMFDRSAYLRGRLRPYGGRGVR